MIEVNVGIVVMTVGYHILVRDDNIPSQVLTEGKTSRQIAEAMLYDITRLKNGEWVIIRQIGYIDSYNMILYNVAINNRELFHLYDTNFKWYDILANINNINTKLIDLLNIACYNKVL